MLLILCFPITITTLQGVNISLISRRAELHLKCQIGPERAAPDPLCMTLS